MLRFCASVFIHWFADKNYQGLLQLHCWYANQIAQMMVKGVHRIIEWLGVEWTLEIITCLLLHTQQQICNLWLKK